MSAAAPLPASVDGDLGVAVRRALAYSDLFDHALTAAEVHRYLPGVRAAQEEVERALSRTGAVACSDGLWTLAGREACATTRRRRSAASARLRRQADRWGALLARLPFVRMVALTGAVAVDGSGPDGDVDLLVVAAEGRVWTCRALVTAVARAAGLLGARLCPNYVLSEAALALPERTIYAARELAQMVPIAGGAAYQQMREANRWADELLPNAGGPPAPVARVPGGLLARRLEAALAGGRGARLEAFAARSQRNHLEGKIARSVLAAGEADFSAEGYKGHFDGHGARILAAYAARLADLERGAA